ncbi:TIR domain-containing protein [Sinorhizobium meliloti]|nr:TIR domain-containing protein [Sinorhizobium meliloti]MDX0325996.1 TIR domain-containing protein [Sinorhizobium meliloti]
MAAAKSQILFFGEHMAHRPREARSDHASTVIIIAMNEIYKYRAFISYSSKDRSAGEKFQRALERYTVPRILRGRGTSVGIIPKRLSPIYRDRSDLEANPDLSATISAALKGSQFLIVICTPRAAASKWVNKEIVTFKLLGRKERIIAVLAEGEPLEYDAALSPNGAYPPALTREVGESGAIGEAAEPEVFAPDLRPVIGDAGGDGFQFAKLKVIARLIGVSLSELTQRQAEVDRKQRRVTQMIAAAMSVLFIAALVGGSVAWRKNLQANERLQDAIDIARRQISTTAEYRDRYGVPAAVIKELLDSAERDFGKLISGAGSTPNLLLQRAKLQLNFANQFELAGDNASRSKIPKLLSAVEADLEALGSARISISDLVGPAAPQPDVVATEYLELYAAQANYDALNNRYQSAYSKAEDSIALASQWLNQTKDDEWRKELARGYSLLGNIQYEGGKLEDAKSSFERAVMELEASAKARETTADRLSLVDALSSLATTVTELDERASALAHQERAARLTRDLAKDNPDNTDIKRLMIVTLTRLGDMSLAVNMDPRTAMDRYLEAMPISSALVKSDPARLDWQRDRYILSERVASAFLQLAGEGSEEEQTRNLANADAAVLASMTIMDRLRDIDPNNAEWRRDHAVAQERLCQVRTTQYGRRNGNFSTEEIYTLAEDACERLVSERSISAAGMEADVLAKLDLVTALEQLARLRAMRKKALITALEPLNRALSILDDLLLRPDATSFWRRNKVVLLSQKARIYLDLHRAQDANALLHEGLSIIKDLRLNFPDVVQYKRDETELLESMSRIEKR